MAELGWLARTDLDVPVGSTSWLSPGELSRAESMIAPKRRAEFVLGRWTAKVGVAITLGGRPDHTIDVRAGPDGAPYVTVAGDHAPLTISITHRAGTAAVLVDRAARAVGCDLELVEPRTATFVSDYLTQAEQRFVSSWAGEPDVAANLVWSAKESVLKLLRAGLRRDTRDVEITLGQRAKRAKGPNGEHGPWSPYSARSRDGRTFPGWWRPLGSHVLTVAYDTDRPPPAELSVDG